MINVPMEAWSVKGISALASIIGKPVIMDEVTTKMCVTGVGRIGFARVLVKIDAEKGIKDKTEIMYKSKTFTEGTKKPVNVEYSWLPCICSHCKVFGHTDSYCRIQKNVTDEGSTKVQENEFKVVQNRKQGREGFNMNRRTNMQNGRYDRRWNEGRHVNVNNKWQQNSRFEYRRRKEDEGKEKDVNRNKGMGMEANVINTNNENDVNRNKGIGTFEANPMAKSHTRNHRIMPSTSVNARRAAYHNRKLNVVDHNQFVIRSLKSVNTKTPQAKHSVNHTKQVWKATRNHNVNTTKTAWRPTRKVVGSVKPQWKPTGRYFALYDNCPLTRIMEPIVEPLELTPSVSSSSKVTMISRFTDCKLSDRKAGSKGLSGIFEC
ncbi:RNA-directed DNA polymerase, eukaryota, reverse transcriptase zinc-binding domain protein [Tanacetum coccineum]